MSLLTILLVILCVGILAWAVNVYVPLDANFKRLFNFCAILGVILWILYHLGVFSRLGSVTVPRAEASIERTIG